MSTPTPAQPGAYDFDETSELDSETAFSDQATPTPAKPLTAAKAILDHFQAIEKMSGERIPVTFKNQMLKGRWDTNTVGIPVKLLRNLEAAFAPVKVPPTVVPFPVLDAAQGEMVDLYSGR